MSYYTSACSSSFVSSRTPESTSPPPSTHRSSSSFDGTEGRTPHESGLLRSQKGRQLWRRRWLATRHAPATEDRHRMVVGTGRLHLTQTSETSFQETPRHRGWYASAVAGRSRRHVEGEKRQRRLAFLLTVIDVFSKVAWCVPMKNKSAASLVVALQSTFFDAWPKTLQTDQGKEFLNKSVQALLQRYDIHHFSTHNAVTKASVVERFNRTLKTRMWRYFTQHQTWRYIDILPDLVRSYNNAPHRSIGMAPSNVNAKNQEKVWQRLYGHDGKGVPKLHVSDRVRISKYKRTFEKGYETNWSEELFTIHEVHPSDPPVYRLRDDLGEVLEGTFYELELQKVSVPVDKVYRVEEVLQRRTVGCNAVQLVDERRLW